MKHYILIIISILCMASCDRHFGHWETLTQVESFMEERPDSVLKVLQGMNKEELSGKAKAKYALMLSMALDKNVIDRTDFEVLQPAIDYYESNGTPTDKLRTFYYQGRIYQNAGNEAQAMNCYLNGLDKGKDSEDRLTMARLYVALGNIYTSLIKWDRANEVNLKAARYFQEENRFDSYVNCLLKVGNGRLQIGDYDEMDELFAECRNNLDRISERTLGKYYSGYLTFLVETGGHEAIPLIINEYLTKVSAKNIDFLSIANAYLSIGDVRKAFDVMSDTNITGNIKKEMRYYSILEAIYEQKGDWENAMTAYKKYNELHNSVVYSVFKQETQSIEQKHHLEMQKAKEMEAKNNLTIIVLICIIALFVLLYIVNTIRKQLKKSHAANVQLQKEKQQYERMYQEVLSERDALNDLVANSSMKVEAIAVIQRRLDVLNTIIVSQLSDRNSDAKRAEEKLQSLIANREEFIKSTRLTLEDCYPDFFTYLHDRGLEEHEIDFCCLYAIGMKGKEVRAYTNQSHHYKESSEVRQKIGLAESDTNLGIFLQNQLKKGKE